MLVLMFVIGWVAGVVSAIGSAVVICACIAAARSDDMAVQNAVSIAASAQQDRA